MPLTDGERRLGILLYGPVSPNPSDAPVETKGKWNWVHRHLGRTQEARRRFRPVYGANVAAQGLVSGLFQYGEFSQYDIYSPENFLGRIRASLPNHDKRIQLRGLHEIVARVTEPHHVDVWFTPWPAFSVLSYPRSLRSEAIAPVSVTHYSLSYQRSLHLMILPTLLSESLPCDSIICTGPSAKRAFGNLLDYVAGEFRRSYGVRLRYKGRLDTIPLGVDTDTFCPRDKISTRLKLGLPKEACILLYFGRLSFSDKADLFPLLTAFKDIPDPSQHSKPLLLLAGTPRGDYAEALNAWIRDLGLETRVRILLDPRQRHLLYSAADIFVSPADSLQENFGLTVIEAMACGVPQVVSDWNGYSETVQHAETGFLVPTYWAACDSDICFTSPLYGGEWESDHASLGQTVIVDPQKMREYLTALVLNAELREKMGKRSRERAVSEYSWRRVIHEYESLWAELQMTARNTPSLHSSRHNYTRPAYFDTFRHYATKLLDDNTRLRLSPFGDFSLERRSQAFLFHPAVRAGKLSALWLDGLLGDLRSTSEEQPRAPITRTIGHLIEFARTKCITATDDDIRRHVMWLLKQGYAELACNNSDSNITGGD